MKKISSLLSAYLANSPNSCMELLRQCHNIGTSLNDSGHRFMKAKLIDKKYSKVFPYLKYVDAIGYDWTFCNQRISGKSQQKMFQKRGDKTNSITIANKLGNTYIAEKMFDYILLTQTSAPYAIAVASYDNICGYFQTSGDKIAAIIPNKYLDFIVHPSEGIDFAGEETYDYGKLLNTLLDQMLEKGILKKNEQLVLSG